MSLGIREDEDTERQLKYGKWLSQEAKLRLGDAGLLQRSPRNSASMRRQEGRRGLQERDRLLETSVEGSGSGRKNTREGIARGESLQVEDP